MSKHVFLCLFLLTPELCFGAGNIKAESIAAMIQEALANNPEIRSASARIKMTDQLVPQASSLDDPEISFQLMEIPGFQFDRAMYANLGIEQMIPYPAKLGKRKAIASVEGEHARRERGELVLRVIAQLKVDYAMLWFSRVSLDLNRENQKLLQEVLQLARTQYSAGKATQQEVLRANIELERLRTDERSIESDASKSEAMLRVALNRPSSASIGDVELPPFLPLPYTSMELIEFARNHRPMVINDSLSVVESGLKVGLMNEEYIPDFSVSLQYVTYPGYTRSTWTAMVGVSIPFAPWTLSKSSAKVQEAAAEEEMNQAAFDATQNMVNARIQEAYSNVRSLESKVTSFTSTILPETEQALQATLADYQTGRTSFLMLLDTYRMSQEVRMEAAMARMNYERAIALLEQQVGVIDFSHTALTGEEIGQ